MSTPQTDISGASGPSGADVAPAAAAPAGSVARKTPMELLAVLVRREFWEHRVLWIAPVIMAAILVAVSLPMHIGPNTVDSHDPFFTQPENRNSLFALVQWGQSVPQYLVMVFTLSYYLLDCLYAERKDRSILFWKSLPVSDAATVISKLVTAVVVVPVGVYLLSTVTGLLVWIILMMKQSFGGMPVAVSWDTVSWLKLQGLIVYGLIVCMLWYAPIAAYMLLVSAWARRNAFLWAFLPPAILVIVEYTSLGTHYVIDLFNYRSWGVWGVLGVDVNSHGQVVSMSQLFDNAPMLKAFTSIDLWMGVAVAAALVFAAVRIRRYRDDT